MAKRIKYTNKDGAVKYGADTDQHLELFKAINFYPADETPAIVEDQNGDGEVSEVEAEEARLKAICDEKGIKYDGRNGVDSLKKKIDAYEEAQAD